MSSFLVSRYFNAVVNGRAKSLLLSAAVQIRRNKETNIIVNKSTFTIGMVQVWYGAGH